MFNNKHFSPIFMFQGAGRNTVKLGEGLCGGGGGWFFLVVLLAHTINAIGVYVSSETSV